MAEEVNPPTATDVNNQVRATRPDDHIVTPVVPC